MAGRFEMTRLGHWAFAEMQQAFGFTLAHYLRLLEGAGMVCGLQKYAGQAVRQRGELFALEVKSGLNTGNILGLDAFCKRYPACRPLVLGTGGLPLQTWFEAA